MSSLAVSKPSSRPDDFTLAVHSVAGETYEWSKVLLARAGFDGTLELLTAAWQRVLGYGRHEFQGKTLSQLMGPGKRSAADVVVAILDERNMNPVDVTLRSRGGEPKRLRLHRRLDAYTRKIFIVAEESAEAEAGCARWQTDGTAARPQPRSS